MSTEDVEDYFSLFKTKKIYWINDFSCLVEFDDEESAKKAFEYYTSTVLDESKSNYENYNWRKGFMYNIHGFTVNLFLRFSSKDVNFVNKIKKSGFDDEKEWERIIIL